jgi:hypothetical protein
MKKMDKDRKPLKYSDLSIEKKNSGRLVHACVGNFRGLGKRKLILHNATLHLGEDGKPYYSYGDGNALAVSVRGIVNSKIASGINRGRIRAKKARN